MKNLLLGIISILTVYASQAQKTDSTYQVTSSGRTALLTKRYGDLIKTWVEYVKPAGHALKVSSKIPFPKTELIRYTKNAQGVLVSDKHPFTYNPWAINLEYFLDAGLYKGGLMYDLLLYVNPNDADYAWRIHVIKK